MEALWPCSPMGSDAIERFPLPPQEAALFVKLTSGKHRVRVGHALCANAH